jgi:hypothetical protein
MSPAGWWIQTVDDGVSPVLFHPAKNGLCEAGTVPFESPPVISTKQKSVGVLLERSVAPLKETKEGWLPGLLQFSACQLNLKIQFVGFE